MTTVTTSQNFIGQLLGFMRGGSSNELKNCDLLPPSPPIVEEEPIVKEEPIVEKEPIVEEEVNNMLQLIHPDLLEQNVYEIQPPQAHRLQTVSEIQKQEKLIPGKFEYIKDISTKEMLSNAWQAITMTENWNFVKKPIESFSWSNDPRINIISNKMVELGYNEHSGSSFGYTMRAMQYIAQNGEEKYKEMRDIN